MLRNQFDPNQPWQAVIYARMSTHQQNARSPDQQIATIQELLQRKRLPWTVIRVYRDDGVSGRLTRRRPQLQQLITELRSGAVPAQLVLVDTFERLTRSDEGPDLRRQLQRAGVLVLTADSDFADPTTISGKALTMVESIRSTEEGRVKAHNVVRGKKDAVRQKQWPGGPPPFGYRLRNVMTVRNGVEEIDHRTLEPDPATRWIVADVFRLADELGYGATRIARTLNSDPRIPPAQKPFHPATVGAWLNAAIYVGELVWGRHCTGIVDDVRILQPVPEAEWERDPEFCEPLIPRDRWDRVQQLRNERRRARVTPRQPREGIPGLRAPGVALKYMLTGLARCAHCGRSMVPSASGPYRSKSGDERRYVAYACPGYSGGLCPNDRRIPEPWLRETVMELVRRRLFFEDCSV